MGKPRKGGETLEKAKNWATTEDGRRIYTSTSNGKQFTAQRSKHPARVRHHIPLRFLPPTGEQVRHTRGGSKYRRRLSHHRFPQQHHAQNPRISLAHHRQTRVNTPAIPSVSNTQIAQLFSFRVCSFYYTTFTGTTTDMAVSSARVDGRAWRSQARNMMMPRRQNSLELLAFHGYQY